MLCRSCLRGAVARQPSLSPGPLQISSSTSLRAASIHFLPQMSRSAAPARSPPTLLRSRDDARLGQQRTYSTSTTSTEQPKTPATESSHPPPGGVATPLEKPDFLNDAESTIWDMLVAEFAPVELVVQDISGGCGSMYGIEVSSEKFRGANMLRQQRMVNAVLGDLMKTWHGVQLKTRVP